MVIVVVNVVCCVCAVICTVDVGLQRVLIFVERGHIDGLTAQRPVPIIVVEYIGCIVRDMGFPGGYVIDIRSGYQGYGLFTGIIRIAGFQPCAYTDFHVLIQSDAGVNRYAAFIFAHEVFYIHVLVRPVKVVVQTPAGIHFPGSLIESHLTDALPCEGARQQDGRRDYDCRYRRDDFSLLGCCCHCSRPFFCSFISLYKGGIALPYTVRRFSVSPVPSAGS